MKAIYSSAKAVRVWLGDPAPGSDDAMAIIKGLGQGVLPQDIKLHDGSVRDRHIQSTAELMRRPWWKRTWVQQELILSKRAVFHCGFSCLKWSAVPSMGDFDSLMVLSQESLRFNNDTLDELVDSFDAVTRPQNMASIYRHGPEALDEDCVLIFAYGRQCQNSDLRDSIYGFLGLMDQQIASKIRPNYGSSVSNVFQDAAIQLTLCFQSLILFSLTSYLQRSQRSVPTWVPTWSNLNVPGSVKRMGAKASATLSTRLLLDLRRVSDEVQNGQNPTPSSCPAPEWIR
jgi:Heterokaryon incompatibility protein (HET)